MAQWLKLEIAKRQGIAMSLRFPLPASFIWNMFETVLPDIRVKTRTKNLSWRGH